MLSPDGTCKTFAKDGNGYVRGEGVGALILKPLEKAQQDGDHILGVLIGSAENHGGRASSLTAPNAKAQAQLIMQAMQGIDPRTVSYIETHGTGTHLGDPAEIEGLKLAYSELLRAETGGETSNSPSAEDVDGAVEKPFCGLGSVKTNVGHLEAAAGIAGVIKVLLAMKHQQLPATLHCQEINPYIDLQKSPFYIVQERQVWERQRGWRGHPLPRRAGVSSFGFGGTNVHVVLEEYIEDEVSHPTVTVNRGGGPYVIALSARNEERLKAAAQNLSRHLKQIQDPEGNMQKIAYTLQLGREEMAVRLALVVASYSELKGKLQAFIEGQENIPGLYQGQVKYNKGGLVLFTADDALEKSAAAWIRRKQYGPILSQWVKGMIFDWNRLYAGTIPGRISLPGYPFAKERFWLPQGEHRSVPEGASATKQKQAFDEAFFSQLIDSVLDDTLAVKDAAKDIESFLEIQAGFIEPTVP
jgi:polyketide synthase PksN